MRQRTAVADCSGDWLEPAAAMRVWRRSGLAAGATKIQRPAAAGDAGHLADGVSADCAGLRPFAAAGPPGLADAMAAHRHSARHHLYPDRPGAGRLCGGPALDGQAHANGLCQHCAANARGCRHLGRFAMAGFLARRAGFGAAWVGSRPDSGRWPCLGRGGAVADAGRQYCRAHRNPVAGDLQPGAGWKL